METLHTYGDHETRIPPTVRLGGLENAYSHPLFQRAILTSKVGRTDLVFSVRSGFISRSVHARLQVFCMQQLWFVPSCLTSRPTDRQHLDRLIWIAQPDEQKPGERRRLYRFILRLSFGWMAAALPESILCRRRHKSLLDAVSDSRLSTSSQLTGRWPSGTVLPGCTSAGS